MPKNSSKPNTETGYIKPREITEEMRESYIDYAMSVIVSRALPDVRDGLKPVQRRILYAMKGMGLGYGGKFRKSAAIVGEVLGKYHPHGDQAVYEALARMAQGFSLRYPLIYGQGNFGSVDGDAPSAMRYTEAKLSKVGEEMLKDIEKNTVNFVSNYDGTREEPRVAPSPLPQLLLNGSLGIAVGMATNIPPHNLVEVCDAAIYLLAHPKATTEDLFQFIKGPDFPTGGAIFNQKEIVETYSQGRGGIIVRGKADIVFTKKGKSQIIISEIPFQVQKSSLIEQLADLVHQKKVEGIRDIRDESDREGLRITIELQAHAFPQKILNRLYKFTDLQRIYYLNSLALIDGIQPKVLSLPEVLSYFLSYRKEVVFRRTKYDLEKAKQRAHILEGLHKCLAKIDQVIKLIRSAKDREEAKKNLVKTLRLTSIQAEAILETKLSALAKLEGEKIEGELKEKKAQINELSGILKSPQKIKGVIKKELESLKREFGDQRRTKVFVQKVGEFKEEDLIPQQETIITLTKTGYIKRINPRTYKIQGRGGKGILGMKTIGEDIVKHFLLAQTHDNLLFFSDSGKVFSIPAYEIPEGSRVSKGRGLLNFLEISSQEKIVNIFPINREIINSNKYIIMATSNGIIKKSNLKDFENVRRSGLIAISLKKGDLLRQVSETSGEDEVVLVTQKGQAIRFKEKEIRPMGRVASGVRGIGLKPGGEDKVISMGILKTRIAKPSLKAEPKSEKAQDFLLVVTENGYGKRTALEEYKLQRRGGMGLRTARVTPKTGDLAASAILHGGEEDLIVISQKGQVIRTKINSISKLSRATQGVRIMKLKEDKVASIVCI